jgi:hypothetical protein
MERMVHTAPDIAVRGAKAVRFGGGGGGGGGGGVLQAGLATRSSVRKMSQAADAGLGLTARVSVTMKAAMARVIVRFMGVSPI